MEYSYEEFKVHLDNAEMTCYCEASHSTKSRLCDEIIPYRHHDEWGSVEDSTCYKCQAHCYDENENLKESL